MINENFTSIYRNERWFCRDNIIELIDIEHNCVYAK